MKTNTFVKLKEFDGWRLFLSPGEESINPNILLNIRMNAFEFYQKKPNASSYLDVLNRHNIDYVDKVNKGKRPVLINNVGGYCFYNDEEIIEQICLDTFPEDLND